MPRPDSTIANVAIRGARVEDAGAIAQLTAQLGYDVTTSDVAARLSRMIARPGQALLVAETDGAPIGWVHAVRWEFIESEPCFVIAGLVVDRNHRRSGVGRKLMNHAEEWAKSQGCSIVRLWSSATRTASHRFYERLGYSNVKTQYAFARALDDTPNADLKKLVPRVDE